jgi:hypothetical protein
VARPLAGRERQPEKGHRDAGSKKQSFHGTSSE